MQSQQTKGGFKVTIPLPSGETFSKTIPKSQNDDDDNDSEEEGAVSDGEKMVIPSKGMPIKGGPDRGDLIIEFRVRRSTEV